MGFVLLSRDAEQRRQAVVAPPARSAGPPPAKLGRVRRRVLTRERVSIKKLALAGAGYAAVLAYVGLWFWSSGVLEAFFDRFLPQSLYLLGWFAGGLLGLVAPFLIAAAAAVYLAFAIVAALLYSIVVSPTPALILAGLVMLSVFARHVAEERFQGEGPRDIVLLAAVKAVGDTARLCCVGVSAVIGLQVLFILLTGFDRDSALYWLAFASAIRLRSITLQANLILFGLALVSAVLPTVGVVKRAARGLKWWGRVKTVTAAFCAFTVAGAADASAIAQSYATTLGRPEGKAPLASLPAREAAAVYLQRCLEAMPQRERQKVAAALLEFRNDPNGLDGAKAAGERAGAEFAAAFADVPPPGDAPEEPRSTRAAEAPAAAADEDRSRSAYEAAREAAIRILVEAAKMGAHKVGVEPNEAMFKAFVDSAIGGAAASVFERIVPRRAASFDSMKAWLGSLKVRNTRIRAPEDDAALDVLARVRLPEAKGFDNLTDWIGRTGGLKDRIWEENPDLKGEGEPGERPGFRPKEFPRPEPPRPEIPRFEPIL